MDLNKEYHKRIYEDWKIKYDQKRKKEKYNFLKPIFFTLLVMSVIAVSFYYWKTDEYKFIFKKTDFVNAKISDTKMVHFGKGYYFQKLIFEYSYNGKSYKGSEEIGKRVGIRKIGDSIKLKITVENPKINKVIGYYFD